MESALFTTDLLSLIPRSGPISAVHGRSLPCTLVCYSSAATFPKPPAVSTYATPTRRRRRQSPPSATACITNSVPPREGIYTVGDFMTGREHLHVVKPTTTVDEALETLVEKRITGFPVIDDDWKLVGVVSDYDLLALDTISEETMLLERNVFLFEQQFMERLRIDIFNPSMTSLFQERIENGGGQQDANMFPDVDSTWKTFNEIQKLLSKTNGKVISDVMTPAPLVVRQNTNLEDAVRLLLKTKYRRLPVVDSEGKLVGIITRGNVVRAALQIKQDHENI